MSTLLTLCSSPVSLTKEAHTLQSLPATYQAPWAQALHHHSDVGHALARSFLERRSKWLALRGEDTHICKQAENRDGSKGQMVTVLGRHEQRAPHVSDSIFTADCDPC